MDNIDYGDFMKKKIYCNECMYFDDNHGYPGVMCKHPKNVGFYYNKLYYRTNVRNKNNSCGWFIENIKGKKIPLPIRGSRVFCGDCNYYRRKEKWSFDEIVDIEIKCLHSDNVYDTPERIKKSYDCERLNKNNACGLYEKDTTILKRLKKLVISE